MSNRLNKERETDLQPKRMKSCKEKLESLGYEVKTLDDNRLEFQHNDNTIKLWPYSGWHSGKGIKDGRGFENLIKQL